MIRQAGYQQDCLVCRAVLGFIATPLLLIVTAGTFAAL